MFSFSALHFRLLESLKQAVRNKILSYAVEDSKVRSKQKNQQLEHGEDILQKIHYQQLRG